MGLQVGVVKISYIDRPDQPIRDFLWEATSEAGNDDWGGSWDGNTFIEFERRRMLSKARAFAKEQNLSQPELDKLLAWVRGLPWDGSSIMLHLSW